MTYSSMPDNDTQPGGGWRWELSEAIREMGQADASGDTDRIAVSRHRYGESLVNAGFSAYMPTFEKVLRASVTPAINQLNEAVKALEAHGDRRFAYTSRELEAEITRGEAARTRTEQVEQQLLDGNAAMLAEIRGVSAAVGKLTTDMRAVKAEQKRLRTDVAAMYSMVTTNTGRIEALAESDKVKRQQLTDLKQQIEDLNADRKRMAEAFQRQLDQIARETLANEIDRETREFNIAFLEVLIELNPDVAAEARRRMTGRLAVEASGDGD